MTYRTIKNGILYSETREERFTETYDLIVYGVGTAGSTAAITAGRLGLSTLAVDRCQSVGGACVSSGVWAYYFGLHSPLGKEMNERTQALLKSGAYAPYEKESFEQNSICFAGAPTGSIVEKMLEESGVKILLGSFATGVYEENGKIVGVELFTRGKTTTVGCKCVIDSADGSLSRLSGCKIENGRKSDGRSMVYSRYIGVMRGNGIHGTAAHNGYLDGKADEEYTASLLNAAATPPSLIEYYGAANVTVCHSETVGKREVGRVEAKIEARLGDWFEDGVKHPAYYAFSHLDNANRDYENEDEGIQTWNFLIGAHAYGLSFGVDMDCLRAKKYENLFLAGKHIGVAHELVGFVRMRADMERCGEAAAVMASSYLKRGDIDYDETSKELVKLGVLQKEDDFGICNLNYPQESGFKRLSIPETVEEIIAALSTSEPELGYIGVMKARRDLKSDLLIRLKTAKGILRENIAVALGLLREKSAVPYLREILQRSAQLQVRSDDGTIMFPWLKETEHCNYAKALCLMNRLGADYFSIAERICGDEAMAVVKEIPTPYRERYRKLIFAFAKQHMDRKRRSIL